MNRGNVFHCLQSADVVAAAVSGDDSLTAGLSPVSQVIQDQEATLLRLAGQQAERHHFRYLGVDRSPAPFPSDRSSAAFMLEKAGLGRFGEPGTLATAMLMTPAIRKGGEGVGFSGHAAELLEDSGLARRAGAAALHSERSRSRIQRCADRFGYCASTG